MPKQIWKIDKFHGGLNSNADPRDLAEGELAEAQDIMVDELGKIRTMGGIALHESDDTSPSVAAFDINPGYGLIQFSHDRIGGHVSEHLQNGNNFTNKWSETDDFNIEAATVEEYITTDPTNSRTFDADANDWAAHGSTTLTWGAAYGRTGDTSPNDGGLKIDPPGTSISEEGAKLVASKFETLIAGDTYKVTVDIKGLTDGTTDFKITLGGTTTDAFDVTTSWATYTKYIKAAADSDLIIFNINNDNIDWYIDNVSIQQVTGITYVHSTGAGTLQQTAANRIEEGIANVTYALTYTVSRLTEPITAFKILGDGGSQFASEDTNLKQENGTHITTFTSHASDPDQPFTISITSTSAGTLHLSNLSLKLNESAETGDDYLAIADNKSTITVEGATYADDDPTINHDAKTDIRAGYLVTGAHIPANAFVFSVTDDENFELSTNPDTAQGGGGVDLTLTKIPGLFVYSRNSNSWGGAPVVDIGIAGSDIKPCFYQSDGALRVSDGSFLTDSKWYGYIKRTLWDVAGEGVPIDEWYPTNQFIAPPTRSYYDKVYTFNTGESVDEDNYVTIAGIGPLYLNGMPEAPFTVSQDILRTAVKAAFGGGSAGSVRRCSFSFGADRWELSGTQWSYRYMRVTVTCGPYNSNTSTFENPKSQYFDLTWDTAERSHDFYFDPGLTDPKINPWTTGGDDDKDNWRIQFHVGAIPGSPFHGKNFTVNISTLYEGTTSDTPSLHQGGALANGYLTGDNVVALFDWGDTGTSIGVEGGIGWMHGENEGAWNVGATFIYDEKQESRMTKLVDSDDLTTSTIDFSDTDRTEAETGRPSVLLAFADPLHNGLGVGDGTIFNKRVTGCNIYMQDVYVGSGGKISPWFLQYSMDFIKGKLIVESTQAEHDARHHIDGDGQNYYYWNLPVTHTESPAKITTYEINSGYRADSVTVVEAYKTAVVSNRMAYIGNVKISDSVKTRVYGDRMMKSSVNQFDKFSSIRVVDASIEDGDEIVKLEEYADRILQFKKQKMHLINVSQDIEFLEETFLHKGISHPASACKTDYGVAWVNINGCYLYDGQKVHNLLEKKGRQIIKESEWDKFLRGNKTLTGTRLTPMIGYLPMKRQLVVYDDITNGGTADPRMYLYDMVTQSWVKGANDTSNRIIEIAKSNFVNDWNGDLVHTVSTDGIYKLSDTSVATDTINFKTNDIDFGQPAQRKKIYKVYVTYKSASDTNVRVRYDVNGGTSFGYDFETGDNYAEDNLQGTGGEWAQAILKPDTSSEANGVKSFQLKFYSTGTTPASFEVNDISIIFRPKSVK